MQLSRIRRYDEQFEKCVGEFLDRYFYPSIFVQSERIDDLELQWKGVDVIVTNDDDISMNIDEKSAAHYVNSDLRTFAFEVSFLNRANSLNQGWLLNTDLETDCYLLSWVYANEQKYPYRNQKMQPNGYPKTMTTDYFKYLSTDDITAMDIVVIEKEIVRNHILLSNDALMEFSKSMRMQNVGFRPFEGYRFVLSLRLPEQPVNILLDKAELYELGNAFHVTRRGVERINQ